MPTPVRVDRHPCGPRVYVFDRRLHHGRAGLWLIATGLPSLPGPAGLALCLIGIALVVHDLPDAPWPTTDPAAP